MYFQDASHEGARVVRLMPNTPCIVREGASVYCRGGAATAEDGAAVKRLFDAVGECLEVPEAMIDAITAVSASGPAYMYLIIEAMADGAVKQGLPRDLAYRLAAQGPVTPVSMDFLIILSPYSKLTRGLRKCQ